MATDTVSKPTNSQEPDGAVTRLVSQLRQFVCGMHGHDTLMHFEHGRISLLCASCGYETPGWDTKGAAVRRDAEEREPADVDGALRAHHPCEDRVGSGRHRRRIRRAAENPAAGPTPTLTPARKAAALEAAGHIPIMRADRPGMRMTERTKT